MKFLPCSIVIVTYNSQQHIFKAIKHLDEQTFSAEKIILVDSGSKDCTYLNSLATKKNITVVVGGKDIGFCRANNIGMMYVPKTSRYILFLNPDAFLSPEFLEQAFQYMEQPENKNVGILTGTLFGYDIHKNAPTGAYDSTGIYRTWYGRWYDRDQGKKCHTIQYKSIDSPTAVCGALMFCRQEALSQVVLRHSEVFDNTFYMYKEDIDLSLRMKKRGWRLAHIPSLHAYHCRGWQSNRKKMERRFRLYSAKNELRIHARSYSPCTLYSLAKYTYVKMFDR